MSLSVTLYAAAVAAKGAVAVADWVVSWGVDRLVEEVEVQVGAADWAAAAMGAADSAVGAAAVGWVVVGVTGWGGEDWEKVAAAMAQAAHIETRPGVRQ